MNALKAAFEQLGVSVGTTAVGPTPTFHTIGKLTLGASALRRMISDAEQGNFILFASLFDSILAEDGSAIADGAVYALVKAAEDDATIADRFLSAFTKGLAEAGVFTDDEVLQFAKAIADLAAVMDVHRLLTVKRPSDLSVVGDSGYAFDISKRLESAAFFTDDVDGAASAQDDQEMQFVKVTGNAASTSDTFYWRVDFDRAFSDTTLLGGDYINMVTGKQLPDILAVSERTMKSLAKTPIPESALLGDVTLVSAGKALLDLAPATDAGSLRSQGFSDFTYFAEDYVGASRAF